MYACMPKQFTLIKVGSVSMGIYTCDVIKLKVVYTVLSVLTIPKLFDMNMHQII